MDKEKELEYNEEDIMYGFESYCPECGTKDESVRPGKTQPSCDCHTKCKCGGRIEYHSLNSFKGHENFSGYFCDKGGPFCKGV